MENTVRGESKRWPLKIYTGGIYGNNKILGRIDIPDNCWKVVFNQKTGISLHPLIFSNHTVETIKRTTKSELKLLL